MCASVMALLALYFVPHKAIFAVLQGYAMLCHAVPGHAPLLSCSISSPLPARTRLNPVRSTAFPTPNDTTQTLQRLASGCVLRRRQQAHRQ